MSKERRTIWVVVLLLCAEIFFGLHRRRGVFIIALPKLGTPSRSRVRNISATFHREWQWRERKLKAPAARPVWRVTSGELYVPPQQSVLAFRTSRSNFLYALVDSVDKSRASEADLVVHYALFPGASLHFPFAPFSYNLSENPAEKARHHLRKWRRSRDVAGRTCPTT